MTSINNEVFYELTNNNITTIPETEANLRLKEIKKSIHSIVEISTLHGLQNILKTKYFFIKLMWLTFIFTSSITCSYFVIKSIVEYFNYNTITTIDVINEQQSQFPTISFCIPYLNDNSKINEIISNVRFDRIQLTNLSQVFEQYTDKVFGNCFRFNSGKNIYNETLEILNSTTGGKPNDLKINFYLQIPLGFDFVELIIFIHNHTSIPYDMDYGGYWIRAGSWNYYEIERVIQTRLPQPYNDCIEDVNSFKMNKTIIDYIFESNKMYSKSICVYLCSRLFAIEQNNCGCNTTLSNFDSDCLGRSVTYYEPSRAKIKNCIEIFLNNFRNEFQSQKCFEYCPDKCDSIDYTINNYFEPLPNSGIISNQSKKEYGLDKFNTYEEVNKHFVVLYVYYKDLKYTFISQQPKVELFDLISNIGGILGLFLGVSFLSCVEFFEIIFEVIYVLFLKKYN